MKVNWNGRGFTWGGYRPNTDAENEDFYDELEDSDPDIRD